MSQAAAARRLLTGYAAHEAALDVLRQMKERLGRRWDSEMEKDFEGQAERATARITSDDVTYANGVFKCAKDAGKSMTFKESGRPDGAHGWTDHWSGHVATTWCGWRLSPRIS